MPDAVTQLLDQLAREYAAQWELLLDGADYAMTGLWYETGGAGLEGTAAWARAAQPVIEGVQTAAAELATGWLDTQAAFLGAAELPPAAATVLEAPTAVLSSPPARMGNLLAQGAEYADALQNTAGYVRRLTSTTARAAEQAGRAQRADAVAAALPDDYYQGAGGKLNRRRRKGAGGLRYTRVPDGRACGWCRVVADRLYTEAGVAGQWHGFCRCTWRLAVSADLDRLGQLADGQWRDVIDQRAIPSSGLDQATAAAFGVFSPGDPWPSSIATTPEALSFMRQAHPGTSFDIPDDWPAETVVPTLRQYDQLARDYPEVAEGITAITTQAPTGKTPDEAWAWASGAGTETRRIHLGSVYQDPDRFAAELASSVDPHTGLLDERRRAWLERRFPGVQVRDTDTLMWHVPGADSIESVMTHEFGHQVDYWMQDRLAELSRAAPGQVVTVVDLGYVKVTGYGQLTNLVGDLDTQLAADVRQLSVYGRTNRAEAWAETFTARYHTPGAADLAAVRTQDAYLRIVRGEVPLHTTALDSTLANYGRTSGIDTDRLSADYELAVLDVYQGLGIRPVSARG